MKTICWVQHASEWEALIPIARVLEEKGYRHIFVCKTKRAYQQYKDEGFDVYYVADLFFKDPCDLDLLAHYDAKYGAPNIRNISASDVQLPLVFKDEHEAASLVGHTYAFWESFFDTHAVDYVIMRETATFLTRTVYQVARMRNIPYSQLTLGPGPGYVTLTDVEEFHQWSELLIAIKSKDQLLEPECAVVDEFVTGRVPTVHTSMAMRFIPISLSQAIKNYLSLLWADTRATYKKDPVRVAALRYGRFRLRKQLAWKYITQYLFSYDVLDENDKFIYFPVYSGLETSYLTHTPYWALNEVSLLRTLALSLPQGMHLYIKEHPHNPGDLSYRELRELQRLPNVKVVRPEVSSQLLIEKSELVCVLEGTAGWEAFLSKNKVLTLGTHAFYAQSPLVYTVTDINTLSNSLAQALVADNPYVDETEWYRFIYAAISTSGRGDVVNLKPPYGFTTDRDAIKNVAEYIDTTYRQRYESLSFHK